MLRKTPIERMREMIRAEVAAASPLPVARATIELLVEGAVRPDAGDPHRPYRIIDANGEPRPGVSLADLVSEIRVQHPALFAAPGQASKTSGDKQAEPARATPKTSTAPRPSSGSRDWVDVGGSSTVLAAPIRRPERRSPAVATVAIALLLGAGTVVTGLLLWRDPTPETKTAIAAPDAAPGPGPTASARPAEPAASAPGSSRDPEGTGSVSTRPTRAAGPVTGVPDVVDAATLRIDGRTISLAGLSAVADLGTEDLRRYLGGREATCRPLDSGLDWRCEVEGRDLSTVVLYNGGARTRGDVPEEYRAAEAYARSEGVGVWSRSGSAAASSP